MNDQMMILIPARVARKLCEEFQTSRETVRLALIFARDSEICRKVRARAIELGGRLYYGELPEGGRALAIVERGEHTPPLISKIKFLEPTISGMGKGVVMEEITEDYVAFSAPDKHIEKLRCLLTDLVGSLR